MGEVLSEGVCDWGASGALVCPESARQPLTPLFRLGLYILSILTTTCVSNGKGLLLYTSGSSIGAIEASALTASNRTPHRMLDASAAQESSIQMRRESLQTA